MEPIDYPDKRTWIIRQEWIEKMIEDATVGEHLLSDHATALFMDLQVCYCIGAWLSVIILSVSVIDAHLRETEANDDKINSAKMFKEYCEDPDSDWLRKLRNKYVHLNVIDPALSIDMQYDKRKELENDATKAMTIVVKTLFQNPGI